ncbi:hypothetical protein K431DRAFT_282278 [Polychaeton citri CBS 116435]|uniref:Uncharacterized protein n=1 Tax=Polychaeton citri CBS 116435 TaxID=1314669 RepID=A0A9P4QE70_9PEZI|nr:hypothetical protein K431DRAFT_282278 [Polychaeton citri CBS 116435]
MPPRRRDIAGHQQSMLSSELGEAPFGLTFNSRTGRPVRKLQKRSGSAAAAASPFVDSVMAVSDPEDDDDDCLSGNRGTPAMEDTIVAKRFSRKRKRSASPVFLDNDHVDQDVQSTIGSDSAIDVSSGRRRISTPSHDAMLVEKPVVPPLQLTFNVPKGHHGPFVVNVDLQNLLENMSESIILRTDRTDRTASPRPRTSLRPALDTSARSGPSTKTCAGFLDLPAELRNDIYRQVFVSNKEFDFAQPTNFTRGAAFLRTCRQVHEEARSILYSENSFFFNRRAQRYGSYWQNDWNEIGYRSIRKFLKSIGPTNTALIRNINIAFEDAVPSLNPSLACNEERRFVHDEALMSILRHLGDYGALQSLRMYFAGRKILLINDQRFIENLKRVKADTVDFAPYASPRCLAGGTQGKIASNVVQSCMRAMVRRDKLYT